MSGNASVSRALTSFYAEHSKYELNALDFGCDFPYNCYGPGNFHGYLDANAVSKTTPCAMMWDHVNSQSLCQYQPDIFGIWDSSGNRTSCMLQQRGVSRTNLYSTQKKTRRRIATLAQRRAANIRERKRMFNLNEAFDKLRRKVPTFAYEKRLSRIETLRLAITYISFMTELLRPDKLFNGKNQISDIAPFQDCRLNCQHRNYMVRN